MDYNPSKEISLWITLAADHEIDFYGTAAEAFLDEANRGLRVKIAAGVNVNGNKPPLRESVDRKMRLLDNYEARPSARVFYFIIRGANYFGPEKFFHPQAPRKRIQKTSRHFAAI